MNFLYPNSEYLIYYHTKVRFFQARLNLQVAPYVHSKYHRGMLDSVQDLTQRPIVNPPPPPKSNIASFEQAAIPPAPKPPEPIKTTEFPNESKAKDDSNEDVKRKRR